MRHLIALGLCLALLAGCAADEPEPSATDDATDTSLAEDEPGDGADEPDGSDEPATAGETTVSIGDFFFEPEVTSVGVGDTVTWTHDGDLTHNVTSSDGSFASDNLGSGDTFDHTFETAGTFEYRCTLHGQMVATVEVS
jgi:plastocyanin